jgi:uncharacterized protein involved in outer membrane biogenesis
MKTKRKKLRIFLFVFAVLLLLPLLLAFLAFTFYKKEITDLLIDKLKTDYNLEAKVGDIKLSLFKDWPNSSITLTNTEIKNPGNEPFFIAQNIDLSFNLAKLLQKEFHIRSVTVKNAAIQLMIDTAGKNNFTFKKQNAGDQKKVNLNFDIKKAEFANVKFLFVNKRRKKTIGFVMKDVHVRPTYYNTTISAHLYGEMFFNQLLFKQKAGPFLYNKSANVDLYFDYYKIAQSLFVEPNSSALIDGQTYNLSCYSEFQKKPAELVLQFKARNVDANKTVNLLNNKMREFLYQFNFKKPLDGDVLIIAPLGREADPQVVATITSTNNNVIVGDYKIPYSDVSFKGRIICIAEKGQDADMSKAKLIFKNVTGKVYKFPFKASIVINDLTDPFIRIKGDVEANAADFNFEKNKKINLKGYCYAKVDYSGPTRFLNKKQFLSDSMLLKADFEFRNIVFKAGARVPEYGLNGKGKVKNDNLSFHNLVMTTKGGKILLSGDAGGFSSYASGVSKGFDAKLNAVADKLDITPLLVKNEHPSHKNYSKEIKEIKKSDYDFSISLKGKEITYRKFIANNVHGQINYANNLVSIPKLNLQACKGGLSASAKLIDFNKLQADVTLHDMDINQLFKECEEFKQQAINSENLRGTLDATVNITSDVNEEFNVDPNSLFGQVKLALKEGHLLNYEPLKKISGLVFRNRNFDDITFTEINETLGINGSELHIGEFELASNVVNLYIEGVYDFKKESNVNLRIPWSNLKRRGENYVPKNLGDAGKDARGLKLNYSGMPGKLKLKLGNR